MRGLLLTQFFMERYFKLSEYLKERFGERVYKISIDGGFTCPNRDGTISRGGCIFCNESGSGEHTFNGSIKEQMEKGIDFAAKRGKGNKYIAYFQSFTSTYAPLDVLKARYAEALVCKKVVGLAIATRPDCIDDEMCKAIKEVAEDRLVWVELGLQTANEDTAKIINRGYDNSVFENAVRLLKSNGIQVVVHLIAGLPNEGSQDFIDSVKYIADKDIDGIKFHSLYVEEGTALAKLYKSGSYAPISREEYVKSVCEAIAILPKRIVVHRVTGDGEKSKILAPLWTKDKKKNLNEITKHLVENNIVQGCKI